ncbi:ribonuclease H-like domain-containing protein, partial [Tanacetum coccineum]
INTLKQNGSSIADYYHKLNALWKQYDAMIKLPKYDSCMQIRSSILSREVLPDVRSAYATISSEESHRVAVGSIAGSSQRNQAFAFVSNVPNSQNFQRSNQNFSTRPSRPNNMNNNRQDEQMATPISLIKDNKVGENVQANMAGANQHMTYTDKELNNVPDISHLKIKVGHPNETEAYISKIGYLRLSNGLTLYDVIVIPEYCVILISIHKLVKENKVIVAFDENSCYFLNHDLNLKSVLGIGEQCEGLYYYTLRYQCLLSQHDWHCRLGHPTDHVLNVLKDSLLIDKKDNTVCCEICQRAKQTREPFPLSDHTSKRLGDIEFEVEKNDSANVFQDVNHINFFDIEYPEIANDDERVANDLNKDKSDSSSSSVSGSNINTADFPVDSGNDADSNDGEPKSYFEASKYHHWTNAMNQEIDALLRNGSWEMVQLLKGRKAIGIKWIYKIKFRSNGEIDGYKARLVAQGFGQNEEVVYMKPPEGYFPSDNKVFRLKKSLYGLKQAPRQWNAKLTSTLIENVFNQNLGKLKYFLGIEVVDTDKGMCLNQRKYVLDLLSKYGMLAKTPLMSKLVISNEASGKDPLLENITDYQKLMGKLRFT